MNGYQALSINAAHPGLNHGLLLHPYLKGSRIILFHGLPNPPEAIKGQSGKWYRHIKPSPWIKDYWINNE